MKEPSASGACSAAPIQPHLHLKASALGKNDDGKTLKLEVPERVGIDVTFTASVTKESNSNYRYYWFIDGKAQTSNKALLTQWFPPTPKDKPHNVVLKAEKLDDMRAAQSTPPVYRPVMLEASIQVSIIPNPEWDCKGRLGSGCNDGDYKNNIFTTWIEVLPRCDELGQICIRSQMSVGAIRHDRCCENTPSLHWCDGSSAEPYKQACEEEWEQAEKDRFDKRALFYYTWKYQPAGNRPSEGRPGWWIGLAPAGVVVSREESEPGPTEKAICKSREIEPVKTLVQLPVNATYIRGNTIEKTTSWVCSANKSDQKINKPPLVNPQGKINIVGNKIVPAVKSKAKKVPRAECSKGPSVLSPSTGGAEGELKKYGAGTDGCAQ